MDSTFPQARISAAALRHNLAKVRQLAPQSRVLAVVKANAYGHGLRQTAQALTGLADAFAVARLQEALRLRSFGVTDPIVLLEGVHSATELALAAQHALQFVAHSGVQLELLAQAPAEHSFDVWLKIDTGMNRLGFPIELAQAAIARLRDCAAVRTLRLMTHLAAAEEAGSRATRAQLLAFQRVAEAFLFERSIANSAAVLGHPQTHADWVRPGLMLYGISPLPERTAASLGLQPAMTLATRLIAVRSVRAGEGVGYNSTWRAACESRIGIAAIGYGDGYPRGIQAGTPVLIRSREAPIVGRVSMDMLAIDLSSLTRAEVGDEVVLWGEGLPVERIAAHAGTIPYELVCRVQERVASSWTED